MGPNVSQERFNKLQPSEKELFFSNKEFLKMFGITETIIDKHYTKNYDNGLIPLHSLEELVKTDAFKNIHLN